MDAARQAPQYTSAGTPTQIGHNSPQHPIRRDNAATPSDPRQALFNASINEYLDNDTTQQNARTVYKSLADSPNPNTPRDVIIDACYSVGVMYKEGRGGPKDFLSAVTYLNKANALTRTHFQINNPQASCHLAEIYLEGGFGVTQSIHNALDFFNAAHQSNKYPEASFRLGKMYYCGTEGVKQDYSKAAEYFMAAHKHGYPAAAPYLRNLGDMYFQGTNCVKKNVSTAITYYDAAAKEGNIDAMIILGKIYTKGDKDVKGDSLKATEYYLPAANKGSAVAQVNLGILYIGQRQIDEAIELFEKAAASNNKESTMVSTTANYNLGLAYLDKGDQKKAIPYFIKAAEQGHTKSIEELYRFGIHYFLRKSFDEAMPCLMGAAKQGHATAIEQIGKMCCNRQTTSEDNIQAFEFFKKTAEAGNFNGKVQIVNMFKAGVMSPTLMSSDDVLMTVKWCIEVRQARSRGVEKFTAQDAIDKIIAALSNSSNRSDGDFLFQAVKQLAYPESADS